jgi:hypothetical protein
MSELTGLLPADVVFAYLGLPVPNAAPLGHRPFFYDETIQDILELMTRTLTTPLKLTLDDLIFSMYLSAFAFTFMYGVGG